MLYVLGLIYNGRKVRAPSQRVALKYKQRVVGCSSGVCDTTAGAVCITFRHLPLIASVICRWEILMIIFSTRSMQNIFQYQRCWHTKLMQSIVISLTSPCSMISVCIICTNETLLSFVENNPLSLQQPGLFGDFYERPLGLPIQLDVT